MVWEAAASLSSALLSSRRGAFYFSSSPGTWRAGSRGDWNESVDALQTPRGAARQAWGRGTEEGCYWTVRHLSRLGHAGIPDAGHRAPPPSPTPCPPQAPRPHSLAGKGWLGLRALIVQAAGTSWEGELA